MEVYLVRHTTPLVEKATCYGQSDIPVAPSFVEEADQLIKHLPEAADIMYSSPMTRCRQLALRIKSKHPFNEDKRLMELNFGDWEMKKWDELNQDDLNNWMQDFVNVKVPSGESFMEMKKRVDTFIDGLLKDEHKTTVIVTHAGVIRCFVTRVLEIPLKNAFKIPMNYGSVTKLHIGPDNCFTNIEYLNKL